jgi:hypothetical protein
MWGAFLDERTGLSFARVTVSRNESVVSVYNIFIFTCYYRSRDSLVGIATGYGVDDQGGGREFESR